MVKTLKKKTTSRAAKLKKIFAEFVKQSQPCDIANAGTTDDDNVVWHCFTHDCTWKASGAETLECPDKLQAKNQSQREQGE